MPHNAHRTSVHVRLDPPVQRSLERLRNRYPSLRTNASLLMFAADVGLAELLGDRVLTASVGNDS